MVLVYYEGGKRSLPFLRVALHAGGHSFESSIARHYNKRKEGNYRLPHIGEAAHCLKLGHIYGLHSRLIAVKIGIVQGGVIPTKVSTPGVYLNVIAKAATYFHGVLLTTPRRLNCHLVPGLII